MAKGLDRDRAVDETGGQIAVFGRLGSRPFTRAEMERLFLNSRGFPYRVSDTGTMQDWVGPLAAPSPPSLLRGAQRRNPLSMQAIGLRGCDPASLAAP